MGVYIKGMEMPKDCNHCRFAVDGWCYAYGKPNVNALANDGVTNWCPLVPVPPHGRLIDADALIDSNDIMNKTMLFGGEIIYSETAIKNAPTIIPADDLAKTIGESQDSHEIEEGE